MGDTGQPPPGGGKDQRTGSYADRLKTNINFDQRLKRNILEIHLEKTEKDAEILIDQNCVARVCSSIGIDVISQVQGYQVQYSGITSKISVWAAQGVNLEKFCRMEGINVSKGVRTGMIRPAGRTDVTVSVSGLDFNTPDSLMFEYIQKFGGVLINNSVIYSKFTEGPFKGKFSGERKYQVDFTTSERSMGTYHHLDNTRVRIFYRGNQKTCGRCHQAARTCPGGGLARECENAGGTRVHLSDHMRKTWEEIGFKPATFTLPESDDSGESDKPIAEAERFRRKDTTVTVNEDDEERFVGMTIANINLEISDEDILKFIAENVKEEISDKNIDIIRDKKKAVATITSTLTAKVINEAMSRINFADSKKKFFGKPLYCRPLRDITPVKIPEIKSAQEIKTTFVKPNPTAQHNPASETNIVLEKTSSTCNTSTLHLDPTAINTSLVNTSSTNGSTPKLIPGLTSNTQSKSLSSQKKKEKKQRQKLKKQQESEKIEKEGKKLKNLTAFDLLMRTRHLQDRDIDHRDSVIPAHCSPQPWKSDFGREFSEQNRRMSFGSSPNLKRGFAELSSPSSPQTISDNKKNKNKDSMVAPNPQESTA